MNIQQFEKHIARLAEVFGKAAFPNERNKLVWSEVNMLSDGWMEKTTSEFIGSSRYAPLLPEWREAASLEREREYQIRKKQQTEQATEFMSSYAGVDIKTICGEIVRRLTGNMPDDHFKTFVSMLDKREHYQCQRCKDTRVYNDANGAAWLCKHK